VSVSMYFISQILVTQGCDGIVVVVDHFSKYAIFVRTKVPCIAKEVEKLFSIML